MRVAELRAVLAPVVAGTGSSAHPDIAAARRFVRGLDAAVADASAPGKGPLCAAPAAFTGWVARLLLRACREHAAEMERCVAVTASMRAQDVDYALRIAAQEQVGLAYAGWDRLLTRVALPAWRMGRWPSRLDAGVVSALTELSRRDRLADGFTSRLGERPACDLLEEPGVADEATSLLAARLFHGGPAESGPDWAPVDWQQYPEEVVDRKWRTEAARLHRVLDAMGVPPASAADPAVPTLARVMEHLAGPGEPGRSWPPASGRRSPATTPGPPRPARPRSRRPARERTPSTSGAPTRCPSSRSSPRVRAPSCSPTTSRPWSAARPWTRRARPPGSTGWTAPRCSSTANAGRTSRRRSSAWSRTATRTRCGPGWRRWACAPTSRCGWYELSYGPAAALDRYELSSYGAGRGPRHPDAALDTGWQHDRSCVTAGRKGSVHVN